MESPVTAGGVVVMKAYFGSDGLYIAVMSVGGGIVSDGSGRSETTIAEGVLTIGTEVGGGHCQEQ